MDYACKYMKLDNVTFNIIIVDNEEIHRINKEYRGIDRPTDVISFALEDEKDMMLSEEVGRILGDIYISIDKCRSQAIEYGHSFLRELAFLSVHGFLHLQGYDHMEPEDEKIQCGYPGYLESGIETLPDNPRVCLCDDSSAAGESAGGQTQKSQTTVSASARNKTANQALLGPLRFRDIRNPQGAI